MTDRGIDVLIAGRVFSDLVFTGVNAPAPGAEVFADGFAISAGGAANRAVAAARLGAHTALVTELGDDPIGCLVARGLRAEPNLDLRFAVEHPGYQIPISVAITDGHDRSFVTFEQQPPHLPSWPEDTPVRVAHVGLGQGPIPEPAEHLRAAGTTLVAGVGWDPSGQWSETLLDDLACVDVLIVNEVEALEYTRSRSPEAALDVLAGRVGLAVITLGPGGALAAQGAARLSVPAITVRAVDPTGAGDAFAAAFMAATAWDWPLAPRLRLASVSATCSVRGAGGARSAPRPADIADLLADYRDDPDWAPVHQWAERHRNSPVPATQGALTP
ncbi:carbohydrate kinase family protein [Mycolicibacterium sp.]|uniref:carbohydrate kinase family protein n=1 Tax=Mycolicibacterium sp. TaxID=2320850 RepID=UPI003D13384D